MKNKRKNNEVHDDNDDDTNSLEDLQNLQKKRKNLHKIANYIMTEDEQTTNENDDNKEVTVCAQLLDEAAAAAAAATTINNQRLYKNELLHLAETIRQTLLEIANKREQNCERRHREKMDLLKTYLVTEPKVLIKQEKIETPPKKLINRDIKNDATIEKNAEFELMEQEFVNCLQNPNDITFQMIEAQRPAEKQKVNFVTKSQNQNSEYQIMRQEMLEMQRKKMEEREQKNLRKTIMS